MKWKNVSVVLVLLLLSWIGRGEARMGAFVFSGKGSGEESVYEVPLTFSTGLTRSTNTITVNTSQNIDTLSNLTDNGFVKTSGGTGALSVDTGTYSTASSADVLTNKTYDVEATGNVFTTVSEWQLPLINCNGTTGTILWDTLASLAPTATCAAGSTNTDMMRGTVDFPDSDGDYSIQASLVLPIGWTGAINLYGKWKTALTTGDVVWQVQTACTADGEADDVAWNTAQTITETAKGSANQLNDFSLASVTTTGCAAGEAFHLRMLRNRTHGSDSLGAGAASLANPIRLTIRRAL